MQAWLSRILNALAAAASFGVLGWGVYSAWSIDFRMNPVLSVLYCALPILSFPLVARIRRGRIPVWWLSVMACAYLAVYAILNWRTCSAHGYCGSVSGTVFLTLKTPAMLGLILATACTLGAEMLSSHAGKKSPAADPRQTATPARQRVI
ncbi:MAG: hypothetical protein ACRD3S_11770 [Terracidiphilus sp.]